MNAPSKQNCRVRMIAGGGLQAETENGDRFELDGQGNVVASFPADAIITIRNIADVASHTINTIVGSRSHVVRFHNGGLLKYAYNDQNELIELYSEKLLVSIIPGNEIVYGV
jgi:hypothetical protein